MELGGYELPPGTDVMPAINLAHTRPDVYSEPYEFRPERFLDGQPGDLRVDSVRRRYAALHRRRVRRARDAGRAVDDPRARDAAPRHDRPERTVRRNVTLSPRGGTPAVLVERR